MTSDEIRILRGRQSEKSTSFDLNIEIYKNALYAASKTVEKSRFSCLKIQYQKTMLSAAKSIKRMDRLLSDILARISEAWKN